MTSNLSKMKWKHGNTLIITKRIKNIRQFLIISLISNKCIFFNFVKSF
jgi:hypothetical protein